jgi:hypothetical protein
MSQELTPFQPKVYTILPADTTDERLVALWLHDLAATTQESYQIDIRAFFAFVQKPLRAVNLEDFQQFADHLKTQGYKEATIARRLRAVKSLFTFGSKTQYLSFNVGAALRVWFEGGFVLAIDAYPVQRPASEARCERRQNLQLFGF